MNEPNDPPEGYFAPISQPLTRRTMYGGVPLMTFMLLVFLAMQLMNFRLYALLVLPPLLYVVLRHLYRRDEWAAGAWLEHVREVILRRTTLHV